VATEGLPLKVFINYRREDTQGLAWGLYWPLAAQFGTDNVFLDNGALRGGDEWLAEIKARIAEADVFLALVGPRWKETLDQRLREAGKDHVAVEIELALLRRPAMTVMAVVVDDARSPRAADLPNALKGLAAGHVERIRQACLRDDVGPVIARLCEIAARLGRSVPPPTHDLFGPRRTETNTHDLADEQDASEEAAVSVAESAPIGGVSVDPDITALRDEASTSPRILNNPPGRVAPAPDDNHFAEVIEEARDTGIIVFLGAGVNTEETLPDDETLARFLSAKVRLKPESADLAEVAQYASALKGSKRMFQFIREGLLGEPAPGHVHCYLASLPKQLGPEHHAQMIVTPKYDAALEHALKAAREPFDVLIYMGPGTESPGKFVHVRWDGPPVTIAVPNEYQDLPIRSDMSLERTLIVRINGSINDPDVNFMWENNYVVTEDHFIQYLSGSPAAALIPGQLIAKLRSASYLFLGYTMADWRLRVFLKRLWPGDKLGDAPRWAIERAPSRLEEKLCFDAGIKLYQSTLSDYVDGLEHFLNPDDDR
jgi:hypothetical protein